MWYSQRTVILRKDWIQAKKRSIFQRTAIAAQSAAVLGFGSAWRGWER